MDMLSTSDKINELNRIICKVKSESGKGTGILIKLDNADYSYLLTTKHCLLGKKFEHEIDKKSIVISILKDSENKFQNINLNENDEIIFSSNEKLDFAVIVLDRNEHSFLNNIPKIDLLNQSYTASECKLKGYPQVYQQGQEEIVTINLAYRDENIATSTDKLDTSSSPSSYNCQGFSGGGVFCKINSSYYLIGMVYELAETFQRFKIYDLSYFNDVFNQEKYKKLNFSSISINNSIQNDIDHLRHESYLLLNKINSKFNNDLNLVRKEVRKDFNQKFKDNDSVIIKGPAGTGKSAFAKNIVGDLKEKKDYFLLAFEATTFANKSADHVFEKVENKLEEIFYQLSQSRQIIILIDGLEKLLQTDNYEAFEDFLVICNEFNNIKFLITCRDYAYKTLVPDIYNLLPKYDCIDMPLLNQEEFEKVKKHFSAINNISDSDNIKEILRNPFYLDTVIRNNQIILEGDDLTEYDFKKIIWDKVIEKNNKNRGKIFEKIVLKKANSMDLYVKLEDVNKKIITELFRDNIILKEENLGESYSPYHDIYEDIALSRFIERKYQEKKDYFDFFKKIGGEKITKRRGFRLWLNDKLSNASKDFSLDLFITDVLELESIKSYWKNEIIIAILKSNYCQQFFKSNESLISENDYKLLLISIKLLKTTCKEPDRILEKISQEDNMMYLKPTGIGWKVVIKFIYYHFTDLQNHKELILDFLVTEWSKKINFKNKLPKESKYVGEIILDILNEAKRSYDSYNNSHSKENIDKAIEIIFRLSSQFDNEVADLILEANYNKDKTDNYKLRNFYRTILEYTLSALKSTELCKNIPGIVCEVAKENWLKTTCELKHGFPGIISGNNHLNIDEEFGLNKIYLKYFPAGIYKTPILSLLKFNPIKALNLIVEVLNYATEFYAKSDRGKKSNIIEVKIELDGKIVRKKGNKVLWGMYRGTVEATPHLLQSILMSLEKWLVDICKFDNKLTDNLLNVTFNYLLKHSRTVATTSVLASVAMAYPEIINERVFPILMVKQFYDWDFIRKNSESHSLAPYDSKIPFAQKTRFKLNQLSHRKKDLTQLILELQNTKYEENIYSILDKFYDNCEDEDFYWKINLFKMDLRKYEVDEKLTESYEDDGVIIKPKFPNDIEEFINKKQETQKYFNKSLKLLNWSRKAYEEEGDIDISLERWQSEYDNYFDIIDSNNEKAKYFADPICLAGLGIKNYHSEITEEQLKWCVKTILNAVQDKIMANVTDSNIKNLTINLNTAIKTLPLILKFGLKEKFENEAKEIIFFSLLHLIRHENEYPFEAYRKQLWEVDYEFAKNCWLGMIKYAKFHKQRNSYRCFDEEKQKNIFEKRIKEEKKLFEEVSNNELKIDLENISFKTHSHWFLIFSTLLIPYNTTDCTQRKFIIKVCRLFYNMFNDEDCSHTNSGHHKTSLEYQMYLAEFLLRQPKNEAKKMFEKILNMIFENNDSNLDTDAIDFIDKILEQIIWTQDKLQSNNFWALWRVLESEIRNSQNKTFVSYLFLSMRWWNSQAKNWESLEGKKMYMKNLIINLGHYDIESVIKLLSGIGAETLLPEGIIWLKIALEETSSPKKELKKDIIYSHCEKLCEIAYNKHFKSIKENKKIKENYIYVLNKMIDLNNSVAFKIREEII